MNEFSEILPRVMATFLSALRNKTNIARIVNRDFAGTPSHKGDKISVTLPSSYLAYDRVASATHAFGQDTAPTRVDIPLDQWIAVDMSFTDKEWGDIQEGIVGPQLEAMSESLSKRVNKFLLDKVTSSVPTTVGTAGVHAFATTEDTYLEALQKLNESNTPEDGRFAVITPGEYRRALKVANLVQAQTRGDGRAIVTGQLGLAYGAAIFYSSLIGEHTSNSLGAGDLTIGAAGVAGTTTVTLAKGAGVNWAAKAGDVLNIAGQQVTIQTNVTVTAGANTNVSVTALENAVAAATAVTVATQNAGSGVTSASCLVAHRDAIYLASRPLADFQGSANTFTIQDEVLGLAFRGEIVRLNGATKLIFDCLFGATVVRPQLAVRVLGAK